MLSWVVPTGSLSAKFATYPVLIMLRSIGGYRKEEYLQSSEMVTRNFRVTHSTVAASLSQYCKRC